MQYFSDFLGRFSSVVSKSSLGEKEKTVAESEHSGLLYLCYCNYPNLG